MTIKINVCNRCILLLFPDKGVISMSKKYIHNVVDTKNNGDY